MNPGIMYYNVYKHSSSYMHKVHVYPADRNDRPHTQYEAMTAVCYAPFTGPGPEHPTGADEARKPQDSRRSLVVNWVSSPN